MAFMIALAILSFSMGVFLLVYFGSKKTNPAHEIETTLVSTSREDTHSRTL